MKLEKKEPGVPGIVNLPDPAPGKGGRKVVVLALLAMLLVGGAAFWLTRDKNMRDQWREQAASVIDNATSGTPLAGAGGVFRDAPPPPPPSVVSPYTAPGTLAGQNVQGTVGSLAGASATENGLAATNGASAPASLPPRVTEDSRVRPQFVESLAAYLVSRFKPGPRTGALNVSVQNVNQRFGTKLTGIADGDTGGRAALLRYAFHPTMLQGLYSLYVDRFMEDVAREARAKDFNAEQTHQLYMALAGRFVMLAGALEGVAATPDLDTRLRQVDAAGQATMDINSQMAEAVFEYDQLRESGASQAQLGTAQLRVDGLGARFRRSLEEQSVAQRALVSAIRRGAGQTMEDDELVFVARWVDRRLKQDAQAMASVQSSAGILRDLARRFAQAATGAPASHTGAAQQPAYSGQATGQGTAPGAAPGAVQSTTPGSMQGLTPPVGNGASAAPASAPTLVSPQAPAQTPAQIPSQLLPQTPAQLSPQGVAPSVPAAPPASPALTPPVARPEAVGAPVQVGGQGR